MANTTYTAFIGDTATDFTRSTKQTVVDHVTALRKNGERSELTVRTQAGNVVFGLKESKKRVITKHTKPFTKTITLPKELAKLVPAGYVAAYERPTNDATVLRNENAPEPERYAVTRRSTGEFVGFAETTRDAGQIMKAMRAEAKALANA